MYSSVGSDYTLATIGRETLTVTNTGGSNTKPVAVRKYTPTSYGSWSITNDLCSGKVLAPKGSCTFGVAFAATKWFGFTDSFGFTVSGGYQDIVPVVNGQGSPFLMYMDAVGVALPAAIPTMQDVASTPGPTTLELHVYNDTYNDKRNLPTGSMHVSIEQLPGGVGTFSISSETCTGVTLAPASYCKVFVTYDNATGAGAAGAVLHAGWGTGADSPLPILAQGAP
jgi:hypothetical protein